MIKEGWMGNRGVFDVALVQRKERRLLMCDSAMG